MIETSLITENTKYTEAWLELLPKICKFISTHCGDILEAEEVDDIEDYDDGKLKQRQY